MIHVLAAAALLAQQPTPDAFQEIQRSHIEANVPSPDAFDRLLTRDLEAYFKANTGKLIRVKHELLRDGPTQSGVAYPKFYLWVQASEGKRVAEQGAIRVAAVERKEFQVTDFLAEADIRANPAALNKVFPAAVSERIKSKLGIHAPEAP